MGLVFSKDEKEEQGRIDKRLALYEAKRKQEIAEDISEFRRSQKNRAVEEILANAEAWRVDTQKKFANFHSEDKAHGVMLAMRKAEVAALDEAKATKLREIDMAQKDFEARGQLRDRAQKAEKEKSDAVLAEKDAMIAFLKTELSETKTTLNALLGKAIESLGKAADKEAVTKVVGFGPSSEPKKV